MCNEALVSPIGQAPLYKNNIMTKLDKSLTNRLQQWLDTPPAERDLKEGATMMLQLNHNRALYNSAMQRPEKFAAKVEYELKKFLKIRLHDMSMAEVVELEQDVMPRVEALINASESIDEPVISTDEEKPEGTVAKGKRADHATLPPEIQALWDDNGRRYHAISILFNELKAMSDLEPCDRFAKLQVLDKTEKAYREALAKYDGFDASATPPAPTPEKPHEESADALSDQPQTGDVDTTNNVAKINAARKTISKFRKRLAELEPDAADRPATVAKIERALKVLFAAGGGISDNTATELKELGVDVEA